LKAGNQLQLKWLRAKHMCASEASLYNRVRRIGIGIVCSLSFAQMWRFVALALRRRYKCRNLVVRLEGSGPLGKVTRSYNNNIRTDVINRAGKVCAGLIWLRMNVNTANEASGSVNSTESLD
jgi:hypothetical protein